MRTTPAIAAMLLAAPAFAEGHGGTLTVYTYDSFIADWGPGPAIKAAFEARCGCTLDLVAAGDGAALLARLRLEGARSEADVVLGLDTNLIAQAAETGLVAPHGIDVPELTLPVEWSDEIFLPYDWGYFAFVHEAGFDAPGSFRELADSDASIVIQDPRSSTPGLGLLMWVQAAYGDEAQEIWEGLADNVVTVTPGWSEAYGLFLEGEADMVLSYTTSPAYHLIAEEDPSKAAALFEEGHAMQIEVMARLETADDPALASDFLAFMLSEEAQALLPTTNWMYPAALPAGALPEGFGTLISPEPITIEAADVPAMREAALEAWRTALSR